MSQAATLRMRHPEFVFVANFLRVLIEWDARASVRIQQRGKVVGMYGAPPTGCLSFIAVPLSSEGVGAGEPAVLADRTVSAGRLRDIMGDVTIAPRGFAGRSLTIPEPVTGPPELAMLPPRSGWHFDQTGVAAEATPVITDAIAEFRQRVPDTNNDQAQQVADEIWGRPGWSIVPIRALHTARAFGFLSNEDAGIQAEHTGGWSRLITASGQIFSQDEIGTLSLRLSVVRGLE